jgi:chromosome segregation ATPase
MATPSVKPIDPYFLEVAARLPLSRKEVVVYRDQAFLAHQTAGEYSNVERGDRSQIASSQAQVLSRDDDNLRMSTIVAQKIRELKARLLELKGEIQGVRQSIKEAENQFAQMTETVNQEFNQKKELILAESREVEAQLAHYAEWQRLSDSFKSHLSDLKSTIHKNRVLCSEGIAETRQNAQAKIEQHRVRLAEAIRQARAESLRLRSGDISDLSTTFLTQSEAHLQSLNSEIESSQHLARVNQSIEEDNFSMQREIERLTRRNNELKEQEQKQKSVLTKLKAIRTEFKQKEEADREAQREIAAKKALAKRQEEQETDAEAENTEFRMDQEAEAFLTFLNECATSIRSVMLGLLKREPARAEAQGDFFEAPKLGAMIEEIRQMIPQLSDVEPTTADATKHILTPAAAYFAFSAPFDDRDDFIRSEQWSFAKYEPTKPVPQSRPRIVRVKVNPKVPIPVP